MIRNKRMRVMKSLNTNLELFSNNSKFTCSSRKNIKSSIFKKELIEKKKIKIKYNVSESWLNNFIKNSKKELNISFIIKFLETRIDNVIYRSGFSKTRKQSRQFLSHGLVYVNSKRISKPSKIIKSGDLIFIKIKSSLLVDNDFFTIRNGFIKVKSTSYYKNYINFINPFLITRLLQA
ncbi:S4 domain-containing protein [Candidatus Vidania fulgoroideorum]